MIFVVLDGGGRLGWNWCVVIIIFLLVLFYGYIGLLRLKLINLVWDRLIWLLKWF